jgi:hypothetical protein
MDNKLALNEDMNIVNRCIEPYFMVKNEIKCESTMLKAAAILNVIG